MTIVHLPLYRALDDLKTQRWIRAFPRLYGAATPSAAKRVGGLHGSLNCLPRPLPSCCYCTRYANCAEKSNNASDDLPDVFPGMGSSGDFCEEMKDWIDRMNEERD
jgi:hypothetical protein